MPRIMPLDWRNIAITLVDFLVGEQTAQAYEIACFRQPGAELAVWLASPISVTS